MTVEERLLNIVLGINGNKGMRTNMKIKLVVLLSLFLLCLTACTNPAENGKIRESNTELDYEEVKKMDEVTVEDNRIIFALYENQALPYRWVSNVIGDGVALVSEENVDGEGNIFSVGVSPSYHIFIFEWSIDGEAEIELIHARYDSNDRNEALEIRKFHVTKAGNKITYEEQKEQ